MPATRSPVVAHKPPAKTVTIDHPKKVTKRVSTDHSANIGRKKRKDDHLLSKMEQVCVLRLAMIIMHPNHWSALLIGTHKGSHR
jgi:hypothetical protein